MLRARVRRIPMRLDHCLLEGHVCLQPVRCGPRQLLYAMHDCFSPNGAYTASPRQPQGRMSSNSFTYNTLQATRGYLSFKSLFRTKSSSGRPITPSSASVPAPLEPTPFGCAHGIRAFSVPATSCTK